MQNNTPKKPELLAPAGSMDKLITAIHYGADAVYLGGKQFSLRARATNFDMPTIAQAVEYAHQRGVKVYVTVNIFAHNRDLEGLDNYLLELHNCGVDAIIVADPGVLSIAREVVPEMPLHLSTQANVTNSASARFWKSQHVRRLNLARELGHEEIQQIRQATDAELEIFIHGALCISYSGRCMLSNYMTGRDANKGDCAHPCRYSYKLVEEKRPNEYFPVEEDERGTYIFNSQDLCLLGKLPQLVEIGADSLKIEGRMKSVGYVGSVVRLYRCALDYIAAKILTTPISEIIIPDMFFKELEKIGTRGRSENFFTSPPSSVDMLYATMRVDQEYAPVGIVRNTEPLFIETRNRLQCGDQIEYLGRGIEPVSARVTKMYVQGGEEVALAHPGTGVQIETEPMLDFVEVNSIFRKKMAEQ
ncbi:peptidase U32 family protein [Desulfogranum japonicum]|uniref:peptidase U32 family protein n=1 Tax=Desulfogranum japonicum TaxID=231447 RepID=UPI0003FC65A8|nr:U32 family peptidase [Desulfogranum japonicum]